VASVLLIGVMRSNATMIEIKHVLCPVDFSAFSRHALEHAVQVARWFKSTLTILYVYPPPAAPPPVLVSGVPGPLPIEPFPPLTVSPERTRDEVRAELDKFIAQVDTTGVMVYLEARAGSPVPIIVDVATALHADIIALGTHGHSGFDRWVLGSVTEKILRKAPCPVLTVPPPVTEPPTEMLRVLKRILCPVDFSEPSLKALEYALALAKEADAELLLMHVIEGLANLQRWEQPTNASILEYLRLSEQHALTRLREVVPKDAHTWCTPRELLVTGKPYEEILRIAREQDFHLIVMGVHGRNPIDLWFFGSTTQQVVRAATCPVLTLRA
jgi:nucleotide-binding universal stress UspA family protein